MNDGLAERGGEAEGDTLTNIENISGSAYSDTIIGDANANYLLGQDGDDILGGDAGNDQLDGGNGNDMGLSQLSPTGSFLPFWGAPFRLHFLFQFRRSS
ncbi:hypothetical protein V1T76_27365 [Roseibium sp. FZY0029]|uniref:hypothetical protein n=1 Tax=Roseibium sp. FZY0029 TaxID=3116647 RepID=UPI002EB74DEF|nr:hypothetical protein [Roseibium sp. FZY0029]